MLSPRKRGATVTDLDKVAPKEEPESPKEDKNKNKEMKKEQKEKEKEMKRQLKEQKMKEKEEKERQKKEAKEKQKAEKMELKKEKEQKTAESSQDQPMIPASGTEIAIEEKKGNGSLVLPPVIQIETTEEVAVEQQSQSAEASTPVDPIHSEQKAKEDKKERRRRRETISALLSPRRFSIYSPSAPKEKEDAATVITRSRYRF